MFTWTGVSLPPHSSQFARQAVICGERIRSDDEATEVVKYRIQIAKREAIDSTVSLWRKVI